jgi:Pentapeptide repeats (8 copies)
MRLEVAQGSHRQGAIAVNPQALFSSQAIQAIAYVILGVIAFPGCRGTAARPSFWPGSSDALSQQGETAGTETSVSTAGTLPPPSAAAVPTAVRTADASKSSIATNTTSATGNSVTTNPSAIGAPQTSANIETPLPVTTYPATAYQQVVAPPNPSGTAIQAQPSTFEAPYAVAPSIPNPPPSDALNAPSGSGSAEFVRGNTMVQEGAYGYDMSMSSGPPSAPRADYSGTNEGSATTWGTTADASQTPDYGSPNSGSPNSGSQNSGSQNSGSQNSGSMPDLPSEAMASNSGPVPGTIYSDVYPSETELVNPNNLTGNPSSVIGGVPGSSSEYTGAPQPISQVTFDSPAGNASHYEARGVGNKPWCPGSTSLLPGTR